MAYYFMRNTSRSLFHMSDRRAALLGLAAPWLVVLFSSVKTTQIPSATIALFYLTLVVFFAIKFSLLSSITTALSGFLAFSLYFSEPYSSLKIREEEDFFTAIFFLVTAFIVSHLASRHNKNLLEIKLREKLSHIEIYLLDKLTQALDQEQVLRALEAALIDSSHEYQLIYINDPSELTKFIPEQISTFLECKKLTPELLMQISRSEEQKNIYVLHDKLNILAILDMGTEPVPNITKEAFRLLMHQANIALERSRLIAELAQEKIAKENELLRSALLSSISHDFRTPLTTMIGATSTVIEMGSQLTQPQIEELLGTVIVEAERLNRYTQNLLDMTRLGLGQLRLERDWISIEEIVNSLYRRAKPLLQFITLNIEMGSDLPPLFVHAALIEQALFNLLDNAIKFAPSNSTIVLISRKEGSNVTILIADAGPGIPEFERDKVFERFYTAARGDRRKSGSGLGMTICQGMINAHGGNVSIHSNQDLGCQPLPAFLPPTGCCIKVTLPISHLTEAT